MSHKTAPHLPPETCRVDTHNKIRNIGWILFFVFVAFVAGLSAALIAVAWLTPNFASEQMVRTSFAEKSQFATPDPLIIRQVKQRTLMIYDKRKKVDSQYYSQDAFITDAGLISSDGWAVAFANGYSVAQEKNWEAIDYQGTFYKIDRAVYDSVSRLLYLKVAGTDFRSVAFVSDKEINTGSSLWSLYGENWNANTVGDYAALASKKIFAIWKPQSAHSLVFSEPVGSLLFNTSGDLFGLTDDKGLLIPSTLISLQVNNLLANQAIKYQGLNLNGYLVKRVAYENNGLELSGFYVADVGAHTNTTTVDENDLVLQINHEPINDNSLAYQVLLSAPDMTLTVWRNGETVEVKTRKTTVGS